MTRNSYVVESTLTKTKRRILRITVLILVTLVGCIAAACGSATPEGFPVTAGPTPTMTVPFELPVTIAISGRFGEQELAVLDSQITVFETTNPDVKVEIIGASSSPAKRREEFANHLQNQDSEVDVYILHDTWLAEFAALDWLLPLDDYVKSWSVEMDGFLPSTVKASTIGGQLWALPWTADGGTLYYRQDLLDKHGYAPPLTWADLQAIALDIQAKENMPYGFVWQGAANETLTCNTLEFVWAHGGDVLDEAGNAAFDSPETRAALQQMSDLIASGVSPPEVSTFNEATALSAFENGEAIFMRNWSSARERLNDKDSPLTGRTGLSPLPASCLFGQNLVLSASSLHPEQAFRFMAFLASFESQIQLARQGGPLPALESVYRDAQVLADAPFVRDLHAALSITRPRPQSPAYSELSEAIWTEVNSMLQGEQGVATTAATIQRRIEAIIR